MTPKPLFTFTKPVEIPFDKDGEIKFRIDPRMLPDKPFLNMPVAGPLLASQRIRKPPKKKS